MTLYILVPVKRLAEAKSRLAEVLTAEERQALARRLLQNVLAVVGEAQERLGAVGVVVSADPEVLELAATHGLLPLAEATSTLQGDVSSHLGVRTPQLQEEAGSHLGVRTPQLQGEAGSHLGGRTPQLREESGSRLGVRTPQLQEEAGSHLEGRTPRLRGEAGSHLGVRTPQLQEEAGSYLEGQTPRLRGEAGSHLEGQTPRLRGEAGSHLEGRTPQLQEEAGSHLGGRTPQLQGEAGSHLEGRTPRLRGEAGSHLGVRTPQLQEEAGSHLEGRTSRWQEETSPVDGEAPPPSDHRSLFTVHRSPVTDRPLNAALEQATAFAAQRGASAVLILPADLPLLTLADVERLWRASQLLYAPAAVVMAPDGQEQGTNALLVRPPGALRYQFGPGSFQRHCRQAQARGLACHVVRSPRLGLDVDLPADLAQWLTIERADAIPPVAPPSSEVVSMSNNQPSPSVDDAVAAFLNQPGLLMRLGTLGSDGYPQVTPVWYLFEEGRFLISTTADRVKARNMRAHPKVGFAVDSDQPPYRGVTGRGLAHVVAEGEAARPITQRIVARYVPAERVDAMVEVLMQAPRVVFAIEVQRLARMGSW